MNIAERSTFRGRPVITSPSVIGCPPDKPYLFRVTAIGERPITLSVTGLPKGLTFDGSLITGAPTVTGCFFLKIKAENRSGTDEKTIRIEIYPKNNQRTPMMGFCSWNAFASDVSQRDLLRTARDLTSTGLADYGYSYINLDSAWQGEYGGKYDAIQPNEKFPDMKEMIDELHGMGYKFGIYSTPYLKACGCPKTRGYLPGCTVGPVDYSQHFLHGGIGSDRREKNNVAQWTEWGVDYLKYDWAPSDTINTDLMRQALDESTRDIAFGITVKALPEFGDYWTRYVNSWRCGRDTNGMWAFEYDLFGTYDQFQYLSGHGHYYDLDILSIGKMALRTCEFTDDEKIFQYSARVFMASPIQLSCDIGQLTEDELDLFSNEEIIAISQDGLLTAPVCVKADGKIAVYQRPLENGDLGIGIFNREDTAKTAEYDLPGEFAVRDVWQKEDLGKYEKISVSVPPHGARIYRVKTGKNNG